jgi:hypothetical protein
MKRGGWVDTIGVTTTAIVGFEVLAAILRPDLSTMLLIAAGSTVLTAVVLWLFFRSVRASERKSPNPAADPDARVRIADPSLDPALEPCLLASAGCTTGWLDWIHGELWVCADGLLRRSLGLRKTFEHGSGPTVNPGLRQKRPFTAAERYLIGKGRETNRWIAWEWIASAQTRRGPITESFHYRLTNGSRGKLLWPRIDNAMGLIEAAARSSLGDRFTGT